MNLARDLRLFLGGFATLFFPPVCAACGRVGRDPFCAVCHAALEVAPAVDIPGASASRAAFIFGGPLKRAIHALKYRDAPELGPGLGRLMRPLLADLGAIDVVVPVPLSRARLVARGFNQARELARGLPLEVCPRGLVREEAPGQVGLKKRERLENPRGSIHPGPSSVRGRSVLVVDDVVTTGATAEACVAALHEAGASRVAVLALARTIGPITSTSGVPFASGSGL